MRPNWKYQLKISTDHFAAEVVDSLHLGGLQGQFAHLGPGPSSGPVDLYLEGNKTVRAEQQLRELVRLTSTTSPSIISVSSLILTPMLFLPRVSIQF